MKENLDEQDTLLPSRVEEELVRAFTRYNAALLTLSWHLAADLKLTLSEVVACEHLRLDGPLTPGEIGERVRLSSGAVTSLLDRLEARGFVKRTPHPSDRRSVLVHYLPQGGPAVGRLYKVLGRLRSAIETLDEPERRGVSAFLTFMAEGFAEAVRAPEEG